MTDSGDRSSSARGRALELLAREERATYRALYAGTPVLTFPPRRAAG